MIKRFSKYFDIVEICLPALFLFGPNYGNSAEGEIRYANDCASREKHSLTAIATTIDTSSDSGKPQ
jgi:hypothetical protein